MKSDAHAHLFSCFRCLEAFCIYGSVGRVEEPYVSITRKKQMPRRGQAEEVERQVGQAEGKLFTHRAAFARTSVIQAFLGSAPQLTLQLYICVLQQGVSIGRGEGSTYDVSVCLCGTGQFYGSSTHPALLRVRHRSSTMWADQLSAILEMREWMFSWVKVVLCNRLSDTKDGKWWFCLPTGSQAVCVSVYVEWGGEQVYSWVFLGEIE